MRKSLKLEFSEAEREAEKVVKNINDLPVCPFAIAKKNSIRVEANDSKEPGVSGFLTWFDNNFGIGYSNYISNEGFIRFTIAHELGHYFLPGHIDKLFSNGNKVHKSHSGFISDNLYEKQADHFAKCLLMPDKLFLEALRNAGEGFAAIESLSIKCQTSITATAINFAQSAEDPVAVIMSCGNKIEWCFVSKALASCNYLRWPKRGSSVPTGTATAEFNKNQNNIKQGKQVEAWTSLDCWFDDGPEFEMKEDVVGLGSYGKTLTVLFTNEALNDENDEES